MTHFETLDHVKMRVGALPVHPSNALKYSLTWSTDGLINEYGNLCYGIEEGRKIPLQPLEGYETIELDGLLVRGLQYVGRIGHAGRQLSGAREDDELQDPALSRSLRKNPPADEGPQAQRRPQDTQAGA